MEVQEIMTTSVVAIPPDMPASEAAEVLYKHQFNCLPVIENNRRVLGVVTKRDLFSLDFQIYFPTYIKLLKEIGFVGSEDKQLPYVAGQILRIKAKDIMNRHVVFASPSMSMEQLVSLFTKYGVDSIPVTDSANILLGIVARSDILRQLPSAAVAHEYTQTLYSAKERPIDANVSYAYKDLRSHFTYVSRLRVRSWLALAVVMFSVGFVVGIAYITDFKFFH